MTDQPDPIVVRSVTVTELMDGEGNRYISFDTEGDPEYWDVLGLLHYAVVSYDVDVAATWDNTDD